MITRRNIRVKVMQVLYQLEANGENSNINSSKILQNNLTQTSRLLTYLIYFLTEVARYAEKDASLKASKHLVTSADRNINIKLAGNNLLWKILENDSYKQALSEYRLDFDETGELVKDVYQALTTSELYKKYISIEGREFQSEREILMFIFTDLMLPDENFTSHIEKYFTNWDDDADILNASMITFLQKPSGLNLQQMPDKEKGEFAKELLRTVIEKQEYVNELIKVKLKNWDPDRIAALDMILMQMGVCEFLYFPTIPPKVTINEYIDLAKDYSTAQSGHFVNGILDNIHKDLLKENKIQKSRIQIKKGKLRKHYICRQFEYMNRFLLILFVSATLIFTSCSESSDPTQNQIKDVMSDTSKFTNIKWQDSSMDFGTKKMGNIVHLTFICTNTGNKPLYLFNVRPGCGCTLADYTKQPIEPGNQGKVEATFDTNKSHAGSVHKTIFVQSNTKYSTFTYLAFSGTINEVSKK